VKLEGVGETIATRSYSLLREGETGVVLLGKTLHFPNHIDFYCPYEIKRSIHRKLWGIGGVDAFQALQLAVNTLRVELEMLRRNGGGQLVWEGDDKGDLGFPPLDWVKG
jgi:hypothetical protein